MKIFYLFVLLFGTIPYVSATDCYDGRYKEKVFEEIDFIDNMVYATKPRSDGRMVNLGIDVYLPHDDAETSRPAIMLAHGGGFIDLLDQKSPDIVKLAKEMAERGYVVFSVDYREEPTFLSLFSEENMVKAVGRALIDIRDATCFLMDTTLNYGNPFGVDPEKVFVGGVSAGAVSFLQAVFLDSLAWLPQQYQDWILEVEPNTQELLNNKYCGANVIGIINVSGAVLDTSWIKAYKADEYPAMMHVHGTRDPIVPYNIAHPFGIQVLPELMGSYPIDIRAQELGIRSELDTYVNQGHAPIIGLNLQALFSDDPGDVVFNQYIMNQTINHMVDFCYSLIDCREVAILGIEDNEALVLNTYPNPSHGSFAVTVPESLLMQPSQLEIFNSAGQSAVSRSVSPVETTIIIDEDLPSGIYHAVLRSMNGKKRVYAAQVMVVR